MHLPCFRLCSSAESKCGHVGGNETRGEKRNEDVRGNLAAGVRRVIRRRSSQQKGKSTPRDGDTPAPFFNLTDDTAPAEDGPLFNLEDEGL